MKGSRSPGRSRDISHALPGCSAESFIPETSKELIPAPVKQSVFSHGNASLKFTVPARILFLRRRPFAL
jgi:hypothetical protein